MRRLAVVVFIIIFCGVISSEASGQEIKIGTLLDHSGALKDWGPHHQKAVNLAVKQMTDAGFSVELVPADSGTAADIAVGRIVALATFRTPQLLFHARLDPPLPDGLQRLLARRFACLLQRADRGVIQGERGWCQRHYCSQRQGDISSRLIFHLVPRQ